MLLHMTCQITRRAGRIPGMLGLLMVSASALSAESVCVRCSGPDQTYRCEATADHPLAARDAGFFCASKIADANGHESCAVQRGTANCDGVSVSFAYDEGTVLGSAPVDAPEPAAAKKSEPETLGEFTKDAVSSSAESMKKTGENIGDAANKAGKATTDAIKGAGSAIGNATKKTWNCLGSALNDC